jgi:hypothetical protein
MTNYENAERGSLQVPRAQCEPARWLPRFRRTTRRPEKSLPTAWVRRGSWERFKNLLEKIAKADPWSAEQL